MLTLHVAGTVTDCARSLHLHHAIAYGGQLERIARQNQMRPTLFQATVLALTREEHILVTGREDMSAGVNQELVEWGARHGMLCECYPPPAEGQGGEGKKLFLISMNKN